MYRQLFFCILVTCSVLFAAPSNKDMRATIDTLVEDVSTLRTEISNLSAELNRFQANLEMVKLNENTISNEKRAKIEKMVQDIIQKQDFDERFNQRLLNYSKSLDDNYAAFGEKVQNAISQIIRVLENQQKLADSLSGTSTKQNGGIAYEVKAGESLDGIATKFSVSIDTIRSLNFIPNENQLAAGQMLFIPEHK